MKTNREHYSWSQQSLFLSSKLSFYKRYVLGEDQKTNIRFEKGKEFADFKETGERPHWVEDPLLESVAEAVPRFELIEEKMLIDLLEGAKDKPEWNKPILMYMDSSKEDGSHFLEYKTGKEPWTQQKVLEHEQLDFYAMLLFIRSGQKIIPKCDLYWIETEDVEMPNGDKVIRYTGHVEQFTKEFSQQDILNMMIKTCRTMQEIHEWEYKELELSDDVVDRYVELLDKKEEIEKELNLIKLDVETQMESLNMNYAVASAGKFSVSKRKNWNYTKDLKELKSKYDKEIKTKQTQEQKDGKAKVTYSESVRFTKNKK